MRRVLEGRPSDHDPFVADFIISGFGVRLRAVTYNVNHDNGIDELRSVFAEIDQLETRVWLLQEVVRREGRRAGIRRWFRLNGYGFRAANEFGIGWARGEWEYVRHWAPLMSPTRYWTTNYALVVVLRHRKSGLVGKFITYHPPAHVQAPTHVTHRTVMRVLREWKVTLDRLARRRFDRGNARSGGIDFVCSAGDDNVDEFRGWEPPAGGWAFLLDGPLEQIQAPTGTHGGGHRRIDDFRVRGLTSWEGR